MPKIEYSYLVGQRVNIERAIELRDDARYANHMDPDFRCPECDGGVRPHKASRKEPARYPAHFEHNGTRQQLLAQPSVAQLGKYAEIR